MSANLRSSEMRKLCFSASAASCVAKSIVKSASTSTWVLSTHTCGPTLSASWSTSAAVLRSAATERFDCFASISDRSFPASSFLHSAARSEYFMRAAFAGAGAGSSITADTSLALNCISDTNLRTLSAVGLSSLPLASRTAMKLDTVNTERSFTPPLAILSGPPCSLSRSTTASVTVRPSSRRETEVSSTLAPLVTTSSMTRHLAPFSYTPSTIFLVP
mmetsp:Transcript_36259/g.85221  ORF Transcript_36259/g.85221 Transcript_36259/m.85221 type:complete len:218 (-) Transcript_36259:324-977(-)